MEVLGLYILIGNNFLMKYGIAYNAVTVVVFKCVTNYSYAWINKCYTFTPHAIPKDKTAKCKEHETSSW